MKDRTGETAIALNGQNMQIIAYRNASDIDVQFEDETIVRNIIYSNFKKGVVKNPNLVKSRIGETNKSNDGYDMTIIAYRSHKDIDIQFRDGTIVTNKRYDSFKLGKIKYPNIKQKTFNDRTGETKLNNQGIQMTIIKYRSAKDIDIQFEDNSIVEHRTYKAFKEGSIKKPGKYTNKYKLGESIIANNGLRMTIIAYRGIKDIDVQFEDGSIAYHKSYANFKRREIARPEDVTYNRIGEKHLATNGQLMTVIKYNGTKDVDVQFEDGYISKNKLYGSFISGEIGHKWPYIIGNIQLEKIAYKYNDEINYEYICKKCHHHDIGTLDEIKAHICEGELIND